MTCWACGWDGEGDKDCISYKILVRKPFEKYPLERLKEIEGRH
jgi:hypothetical protein